MKKQIVNVICFQEVHIRKKDQRLLGNSKLGLDFYSLSDKKVRGVLSYGNKDLNPNKVFANSNGRYLTLEIIYNNKKHYL